jgi:hypothetical protein
MCKLGLSSRDFKENGCACVHYASLPFNRGSVNAQFTVELTPLLTSTEDGYPRTARGDPCLPPQGRRHRNARAKATASSRPHQVPLLIRKAAA